VYVRDDWLNENFVQPLVKRQVEAFVMFDCCHSGTMLDLAYNWDTGTGWTRSASAKTGSGCTGVVFLSGCQDKETAQELTWTNGGRVVKRGGALTLKFLDCLDEKVNGNVGEFMTFMIEGVKAQRQRPCLSSSYEFDVTTKTFDELLDGVCRRRSTENSSI